MEWGISFACLGSPCDQIPLDNLELLFLNGDLFNPLHTVGKGEKRSMINPLQKTGDWRCGEFIQIEIRPYFIDRNPPLGLSGLYHEPFKKVRNIPIACHEQVPVAGAVSDAPRGIPAVSADTGTFSDRRDFPPPAVQSSQQ